jgi:hypothetical protein
MITRKQYMSGESTHREYYGQFVTESIKNSLLVYIGKELIMNSTDESFNDIPLSKWDRLPTVGNGLRECGDVPTLSGSVCIYKEAAKQIKEGK